MTTFALALSPHVRSEVLTGIQGLFIAFVFIGFVCVAEYTMRQVRAGRLFTREHAPLPLEVQPMAGWFFIASVVSLIYLQSILYALIVFMGIAGMLAENRHSARLQFGLDRLPFSRALAWGLFIIGGVILVEYPLGLAWAWLLDVCKLTHPEQTAVESFRHYNEASQIFGFMLEAVILSPMIEELFFRGFLLAFLKKYFSTWGAIVVGAGIFALAHFNLGTILPLWFLAVVLGVAYEHTGSLVVPIVVHGCFNLITGLNLLLDKANSS